MTDRRTTRQLPRSERQTDGPPRDAPTAPGPAEPADASTAGRRRE